MLEACPQALVAKEYTCMLMENALVEAWGVSWWLHELESPLQSRPGLRQSGFASSRVPRPGKPRDLVVSCGQGIFRACFLIFPEISIGVGMRWWNACSSKDLHANLDILDSGSLVLSAAGFEASGRRASKAKERVPCGSSRYFIAVCSAFYTVEISGKTWAVLDSVSPPAEAAHRRALRDRLPTVPVLLDAGQQGILRDLQKASRSSGRRADGQSTFQSIAAACSHALGSCAASGGAGAACELKGLKTWMLVVSFAGRSG